MSDFVSSFWSYFVAGVSVLALLACLGLLIVASKRQVMADGNTTGQNRG